MNSHSGEYNAVGRIFCKLKDIRNSIKRCSGGKTLDEIELYEIKYFSMLVTQLKNVPDKLHLNIDEVHLHSFDGIIYTLNPKGVGISTFYVYDEYSKNLKYIRNMKKQKEKEIFNAKTDGEISQ